VTDRLTGDGQGPVYAAATVVLLRDTLAGVECLMLRKNQGQTFGGVWVFPGGRVEDVDGSGDEGLRRAAVREAEEETGLRIDATALVPLSRWMPPPQAPKRFNTWFFVAPMPDGACEVVVDGKEIGDHVWTAPAAALAAQARGEVELLPPTWVSLHQLSDHPDVATALAAVAAGPTESFMTRIVNQGGGVLVSLWRPDAAYPARVTDQPGPLDAPGLRHRLYMDPAGWRYERTDGAGGRDGGWPGDPAGTAPRDGA
jgi:8-oxo-dGTP pyrophosphatase MutT (NUDIX family)